MSRRSLGFSTLFPALGTARFIERHWPTAPAWHHGPPARLGRLLELNQIGNIVRLASRSHMQMKAIMGGTHHDSNEIPIESDAVISLYDAGATVSCSDLHRWHTAVAQWTNSLTRQLRVPPGGGGCNLYLSPRGRGVGMHFDDHEVVIVQLAGRKRWRFAVNRTVSNPTENSGRQLADEVARYAHRPSPRRMPRGTTVELTPGSVLFLPRGYWHATDAREMSISLTFGFRTPNWAELVGRFLASRLVTHVEWREPAWHAWEAGFSRRLAEQRWLRLRKDLPAVIGSATLADIMGRSRREALAKAAAHMK